MKWKSGANNLTTLSFWSLLGAVAVIAFFVRWVDIGERPVHTDEAVHAVVLGNMLRTGAYAYNPQDAHGPLLYYIAYPLLRVLGVRQVADLQAWHLRLIPTLIGCATILSLGMWRKIVPDTALLAAAILLAIAAPIVYYQRYFIHESLFVLLTLLALNLLVRVLEKDEISWGFCTGFGAILALILSTKETAPAVVIASILAIVWIDFSKGLKLVRMMTLKKSAAFLVPFLLITCVFFSSFGTNLAGIDDLFAAQFRFAHRATGEGHEKPWWTYLNWLFVPEHYTVPWSGWATVGLGCSALFLQAPTAVRFVAAYSIVTGVVYSVIPYKTPWLEINILGPACIPAGFVFSRLSEKPFRIPTIIAGALILALMLRETRTLCYLNPADSRNPLAYSPTVTDVNNLALALAN